MRVEAVVANGEIRRSPDLQPDAIAVIPRRRGMNLQLSRQLQLGDAPQIFFENSSFDFELMLVTGVLVVASATAPKIWAWRLDPKRRRRQNLIDLRPRETGLVVNDSGFDAFAFEH